MFSTICFGCSLLGIIVILNQLNNLNEKFKVIRNLINQSCYCLAFGSWAGLRRILFRGF